jgi:hypothetical protein
MYSVRTVDGESMNVRRDNLRHRKWYRLAYLQVTNDKKHDCWSSQAFACRRLAFYDISHKQGLEEALKFALHDEAEIPREAAAELAQNAQSTAAAAGSVANGASIEGQAAAAVLAAEREARAPVAHQQHRRRCEVSEEEFERRHAKWLKMVWVEFGCPGHGKGPWDGLGAMAKSKVNLDIMHGKERTSTGKITSAVLVAQHLRAIFCNKDWDMEHADMKIQ